jgi:hypothetical protein
MTRTSMEAATFIPTPKGRDEGPSLFDIAWPAPVVPVDTSEAAADALTHTEQGRARRRATQMVVLELVGRSGGATIDEVDEITEYGTGTICPRVDELRAAGWIETTAAKRLTRKGSAARVHVITKLGRDVLAARNA